MLPACAVFWFATSILIGKIKNDKIFSILLILILVIGAFGIISSVNTVQSAYDTGIQNQNVLDGINNKNTTVICIGPGEVILFGTYLNESNMYMDNKSSYGIDENDLNILFNITYSSNLNKTINENKENNIILMKGEWIDSDLITSDDQPFYNIAGNQFYNYNQL